MLILNMFHFFRSKAFVFFLLCCLAALNAENKQVVAEMQLTTNDSLFKYSYIYNDNAQIVVETKQFKTASGFENQTQKEWTYQTGLPASQVERKWESAAWQNSSSLEYSLIDAKLVETYSVFSNNIKVPITKTETEYLNAKKHIVSIFTYNNGWVPGLSTQYFYGSSMLDSTIVIQYNQTPDAFKTYYAYNPDSTCNSVVVQKRNLKGEWINYSKSTWYYKSKKISSLRNYNWNTTSLRWVNASKLEYAYNESLQPIEEIYWWWKGGFWEQTLRYAYEYNSGNQQSKKLVSIPLYRDWRNTNSVNYIQSVDSKNMTIESVYGFWGGKTGDKLMAHISFPFNDEIVIQQAQTIQLTYAPFIETSSPTSPENASTVKVYPNPSHGVFYISNIDAANCSWTLSSLTGSVLKNSTHHFVSSTVDINDLPNGVYLLKIQSNNFTHSQKIVKY
jgi:hypothetical protein